jgi:predicted nucleic acid-binding protein
MILLDTDILIDSLRNYQPSLDWFQLNEKEQFILPGYVYLELIKGCRTKKEIQSITKKFGLFDRVWLSQENCELALQGFAKSHLSKGTGIIDILIAHTALSLNLPLYTFNVKHYSGISKLKTIQPYSRNDNS